MTIQYYQLLERASEANSIGVIKVENGEYPKDQIKKAIQSHLDEEIEIVDIKELTHVNSIEIHIKREHDSFDQGETDVIEGIETWLYF
jgi:hypothetical protein